MKTPRAVNELAQGHGTRQRDHLSPRCPDPEPHPSIQFPPERVIGHQRSDGSETGPEVVVHIDGQQLWIRCFGAVKTSASFPGELFIGVDMSCVFWHKAIKKLGRYASRNWLCLEEVKAVPWGWS